jgi:hypothetical protein
MPWLIGLLSSGMKAEAWKCLPEAPFASGLASHSRTPESSLLAQHCCLDSHFVRPSVRTGRSDLEMDLDEVYLVDDCRGMEFAACALMSSSVRLIPELSK